MRQLRLTPLWRGLCIALCALLVCGGLYLLERRADVVWDLTPDALTELSEGTLDTLGQLAEPVHLYTVFRAETETSLRQMLATIAGSYARLGPVMVNTIDPVAEPGRIRGFAQSGRSIAEGSVIVANADESRHVVIDPQSLYTYRMTAEGSYALTGFLAEQKITEAIRAVTGGEEKRVFFLTGHGEAGMAACSQLTARLESENFTVGELALAGQTQPEEGDILLMLSPARDLAQEEAEILHRLLDAGGRLLLALDASLDLSAMPNTAGVARRFSLEFAPGIVVEDERMSGWWMNSPLYLMPGLAEGSPALSGMSSGQRVIIPGARAVTGPEIPLSGYSYEALLTTSDKAYICPIDSPSMARTADMPTGTQQLAVMVSHVDEETGREMCAVLMGSLYTLLDNSLLSSTYNLDMSMSVIRYLAQREAETVIPVRSLTDTSMPALSRQESLQALLMTLMLPLAAAAAGIFVLMRRRKK
ncbi:MAG: Gldg family protein [Clostridia bacterium]|nr:Gldg family protein [Clostridia bacterium]